MSHRVVVVDHHDSYTYNLVHLVAAVTGTLPTVLEHDEAEVDEVLRDASHVVLSPGPGSPHDARDFAVGRDVLRLAEVPVLGVCLGMQGMVSVYGGRVAQVPPAHGEVAVVRHHGEGVLRGVPDRFEAVRYHSLAAVALPPVLTATAWCDTGHGPVVMAVAHRTRPQHGVQFHPESVLSEHGERIVANFLELA